MLKQQLDFFKLYKKRYIIFKVLIYIYLVIYLFSHLADAFVQSDLQMRTIEAIKYT